MIPIDEQIKYQTEEAALANASGKLPHRWSAQSNAILASLERLKAIESVQVPEEPEWLKYYRTEVECGNLKDYKQFINHIDTLSDLLKTESARADAENREVLRLTVERNTAEATISAMLKLGAEPSEEMKALARTALKISSIKSDADAAALFSFMFAKLAEQAGVKK